MELEEAKTILSNVIRTKTNKDKYTLKSLHAIEIVLNELDKLQKQNQNLREYLANQGMISDYMRFRNTKK